MEQYIVSARKYRPSTFATVVGQKALTSTLKNAIASDRLAHSYLFCGSRGVGKTSCARIFAKTINCNHRTPDGEACNECDSCRAFNQGNSLNIIELDAASHNGIEDMKELIKQVQVPPTHGRYRVFIIDEVHMLSNAAFNAFLKTLEEPPSYVVFILATTEKHKIIPTILSRCQIYDFSRITTADMVEHLQYVARSENIEAEPSALNVIARQADGAMRDALSIFDQVAASSRGHITYAGTLASLNVLDASYYERILQAVLASDIPSMLLEFHEIRRKGFDPQFFINGLAEYIRDLMMAYTPETLQLVDAPDDVREALASLARKFKPEFLYAAMALCNDADLNYRQASNKQLLIELTLIRIAQLLNPSPDKSGLGEGSLKPISKSAPAQTTATPTPAPAPAPKVESKLTPQQVRPSIPVPPPPAPAPAASATPPPQRKGVMRAGGLSISARPKQQETISTGPRLNPYDESNVAAAWAAYINDHPADRLLVSAMAQSIPSRVAPDRYVSTARSEVEGHLIREVLDALTGYIRNKIANDNFELEITVEAAELPPRFWNDRQVLDSMLTSYPALADFIKDFNLVLI